MNFGSATETEYKKAEKKKERKSVSLPPVYRKTPPKSDGIATIAL